MDTDYNEESFFVRQAYFLGAGDPYKSLKTTLKAEIDADAWATLHSDTSRSLPETLHRPHRREGDQPSGRRGDEGVRGVKASRSEKDPAPLLRRCRVAEKVLLRRGESSAPLRCRFLPRCPHCMDACRQSTRSSPGRANTRDLGENSGRTSRPGFRLERRAANTAGTVFLVEGAALARGYP